MKLFCINLTPQETEYINLDQVVRFTKLKGANDETKLIVWLVGEETGIMLKGEDVEKFLKEIFERNF